MINIVSFVQENWWDLLIILITVLALLTVGKIFYLLFYKKLKKIASKTKTDVDDKILEISKKPVYLALLIAGLQFSLNYASFTADYSAILNKIFSLCWIGISTYIVVKIINIIIESAKSRLGIGLTYLLKKIVSLAVGVVALMFVLNTFGVEISPLLASLGIAGLAVALALQDTLSNFFAGIYLTADQPIRPGDFVEIGGDEKISGTVLSIGWRTTKLKTPQNNVIVIPNKKLGESIIINYNLPDSIITTSVEIEAAYDSDVEKVEKVIYETAKKIRDSNDKCVKDFEPIVRFYEFGSSGLKFKVFLKVKTRSDKFSVGHELRKALFKAFKENNIEIPFTTHTVYLKENK
ncbi:MAG: mechanosensitive ion channel family protein [Nanoarchaeota archaeon]|nr:mechanosensitive ion channel family protein [Nanoarchaeota archaeon]